MKKIALVFTALICLVSGIKHLADNQRQYSVKAFSPALKNRTVLIDPGHGGVDPGAVGKENVLEKHIVLEVSRRLSSYLNQGGAETIMTRETDTDLSDPDLSGLYQKKRQDLSRRVGLANNGPADCMISIHVNSIPNSSQYGAQAFYQPGSSESGKLAQAIQSELNSTLKDKLVPLARDYYITRQSGIPTIIVEIGFISNPKEYKLLQEPTYQSRIAWCLYTGLIKYFMENQLEKR